MKDEPDDLAKYAIRCALRASALVKEALSVQKQEERDHISRNLAAVKISRLNAAATAELKESLAALAEFDTMVGNGKDTARGRPRK